MDTLRIILIAGGVLLLLGIYLWDRIKARRAAEEERWQDIEIPDDGDEERIDPLISQENPFDEGWQGEAIQANRTGIESDETLKGLQGVVAEKSTPIIDDDVAPQAEVAEAPQTDETPEETVIILSLMAEPGHHFNGMQLLDAMELCGLSYGDMNIFHYPELDSGKTLFSVANVLEPGSFDRDNMGDLETPGLALFMPLPAPIDGEKALLTFIQQAKRLKEQLNGVLTDRQRRELTRETLDELKQTAQRYTVSVD